MSDFDFNDVHIGSAVYSENYMAVLAVVRLEYAPRQGRVLFLSADGKDFDWSRWHEGESGPAGGVYVEVRSEHGRWSHGWVDRNSRCILQVG